MMIRIQEGLFISYLKRSSSCSQAKLLYSFLGSPPNLSSHLHRELATTASQVRVRFAPSPTGHIHLGGLRAALYNFLFAKQNNGRFILRIEDTDRTRIVPNSAEEIEQILNWASLKPDESPLVGGQHGPYRQSERLNFYEVHAKQLLDLGKAYRCFCSANRLDLLRKFQSRNREKIRYDGKCRNLTPQEVEDKLNEAEGNQEGRGYVIRFALAPGTTTFEDTIFGPITNNLVEALESDPVIIKSDGYPTYHFANIVDDHAMDITHVLRGSEWISSTAKHVQLYEAFKWRVPVFAHFPLITLQDGTKMSKRNDHSHVRSFIDAGYSARALMNFLTNIGGGVPKSKQDSMELWTLDQLIKGFDLKQVTCHPGSADMNRLRIYSAKDLQKCWQEKPDEVMRQFSALMEQRGLTSDLEPQLARSIVGSLINRLTTLNDLLAPDYQFIWRIPQLDDNWSPKEYLKHECDFKTVLLDVIEGVKEAGCLDENEKFLALLKTISERHKLAYPQLMKFLRKLLTNKDVGLPLWEIANCLGQTRLIEYLNNGLKHVQK